MKLLLATQDFPPTEGGIARGYASLAGGFQPQDIIVSTTAAHGMAGDPPEGCLIHRQPFPLSKAHRPVSLWMWSRSLDTLIRTEKPDVLLCGNLRPLGPLCPRLAGRHSLPYYLLVHGNDLLAAHRRWSGLRKPIWRSVTEKAARWTTNSEAVRRLGIEVCGLPPEQSAVLLPEVDTVRFRPADAACQRNARLRLRIPTDELVVLFVGRLVTRKGVDRLLEATAQLKEDQELRLRAHSLPPAAESSRTGTPVRWRLVVAGFGDPGPYGRQADRLGISEKVQFLGPVAETDLPSLYQAADIAAMPSRTIINSGDIEGFGLVYLEAAASGLPVIAGRSGGAPETLEDGRSGIVVNGEDARELAHALRRLLEDEALRRRMGEAGRALVETRFRKGALAERWKKLLADDRASGLWAGAFTGRSNGGRAVW